MAKLPDIIRAAPSGADVAFFLHALVTRPGDAPGILRREAARRRAGKNAARPDPAGLRAVTDAWEAALTAGVFRAARGDGPAVEIAAPIVDPLSAVSALQWAASVNFHAGAEDDPAFPVISLEAARLAMRQCAERPDAARKARRAYVEDMAASNGLRAVLYDLCEAEIAPLGAQARRT